MINFLQAREELNNYKGSEKKKTLIYNNKKYLVKFPDPIREKNKNISYINNALSEYIGSNIFKMIGFKTQNTLLGTYIYNGIERVVCACEDFTDDAHKLYEFENLALSTNPDKKITTEINDITEVIKANPIINKEEIQAKFWDMFIVDSLIGNTNRHNGNWGFLLNSNTKELVFAPIYDCGSCLNPLIEEDEISKLEKNELKNLALNCYSCLKEQDKRIHYMNFIKSLKNEECNNALMRIFPKINLTQIIDFINNIECITKKRKKFYQNLIEIRYNLLEKSYNKLTNH